MALVVCVTLAGLAIRFTFAPRLVRGPDISGTPIAAIIVEPIKEKSEHRVVITDPEKVAASMKIFSAEDWEENRAALLPAYRVIISTQTGSQSIYWLGTFSDPPRFPCYWFCSGFWIAASSPDGTLATNVYKALATSGDMIAVARLLDAGD